MMYRLIEKKKKKLIDYTAILTQSNINEDPFASRPSRSRTDNVMKHTAINLPRSPIIMRVSVSIQIQEFPSEIERQVEIRRRSRMIWFADDFMHPRAVTRKRNNEGRSPPRRYAG